MLPHGADGIERPPPRFACIQHSNPCVIAHGNRLAVTIHGACHEDQTIGIAWAIAHEHLVHDEPCTVSTCFIAARQARLLPGIAVNVFIQVGVA